MDRTLHDARQDLRVVTGTEQVQGSAGLASLSALEEDGARWRNRTSLLNIGGQMLGGQIAALGMSAAALSAPGFLPSAIHILFSGAPDPARPCQFAVEVVRDGRRFKHRLVRITQEEQTCAQVTVTLMTENLAAGTAALAFSTPAPDVPAPESLPNREAILAGGSEDRSELETQILMGHPFLDIRYIPSANLAGAPAYFWVRIADARGLLPIQQLSLLTLVSDYWCTLPVHDLPGALAAAGENFISTSLDHAVWFHGVPECSGWILFEMQVTVASQGLVMKRAIAWGEDGQALMSVKQQGLIRRGTPS